MSLLNCASSFKVLSRRMVLIIIEIYFFLLYDFFFRNFMRHGWRLRRLMWSKKFLLRLFLNSVYTIFAQMSFNVQGWRCFASPDKGLRSKTRAGKMWWKKTAQRRTLVRRLRFSGTRRARSAPEALTVCYTAYRFFIRLFLYYLFYFFFRLFEDTSSFLLIIFYCFLFFTLSYFQ